MPGGVAGAQSTMTAPYADMLFLIGFRSALMLECGTFVLTL